MIDNWNSSEITNYQKHRHKQTIDTFYCLPTIQYHNTSGNHHRRIKTLLNSIKHDISTAHIG